MNNKLTIDDLIKIQHTTNNMNVTPIVLDYLIEFKKMQHLDLSNEYYKGYLISLYKK